METCGNCGKEFKSKSGLTLHKKNCKEEPKKIVISEENKRKIAKLKDALKSTYDAQAKHDIEQEIKRLEGSN